MTLRILSGIQSSGKPHLGNYFGAMQQHVQLQDIEDADPFYFIADYHAMTTVQDPEKMREFSRDVALDYLASGLDPDKATFFRQSSIPEVTELAWMLCAVTGMGLLERAHSYKDKVAKGIKPSVGLFYYPVLMAADILIYKSHQVPVGQDQVQHIEMTQDMAEYFNNTYHTEVFVRPEARMGTAPKVLGTDGAKMSKSYGNTIDLSMTGKPLKKVVMSIKTDSKGVEEPKDPETCNVFALYRLLASESEQAELADRYRAGGMGYGDSKKLVLEKIEDYFQPYREKRAELLDNLDYVESVLTKGATRAREIATQTVDEAKKAAGLL